MRPADNINELIKGLHLKASADLDRKVHDDISNALAKSKKTASAQSEPNIWRIIMKSKITKLAAAAAIIVAFFVGVHQFGGSVESVAFADVVQAFLTARTAMFKVTITGQGVPTQEYDGMFMEPCRMRHDQPGGGTVIVDLEKGKFVTLLPQLKQAIVLELTNIPEDPGSLNFFQEIRNRILKAQPLNDESVEFLGRQQVDGQSAIGYHVRKPGLDATVWANAETKMPVRIEVVDDPMIITMSNIAFDVQLDEKLFSLDIPEGYSVKTLRRDLSEPTEQDFIESFRIWAEHMDGNFPAKMDRSAVNEFVKYQQEKMKQKGVEPTIEDITKMQQTIIDMTHGFPFVESLPADSDWHYAGKDVKFGDANTPIFWYRPKGSKTYRIIYGDLNVKDVTPEKLPK
jgi:outer membrane lipoprotein-sorting protein